MEQIIRINLTEGNATPLVREALKKAERGKKTVLLFEKGTYRFHREGAFRGMFYVSNNASCEKDVIFPILDTEDIEIRGNGAEFLFCDRVTPFVIGNSASVVLSDFSIDFSFPRHCEGTVKSIDEAGFLLSVDKEKFPFEVKNGNILFAVGSEVLSTADRKLFLANKKRPRVSYLFCGDCTESRENLPVGALFTDAVDEGDGIRFLYRETPKKLPFEEGDLLLVSNDERRENSVIFAEASKGITLRDITVYRGAGMGLIAQMCEDITLEGVRILPKEGRDSLLSVTADAVHLVHCSGLFRMENCHIRRSVDDAVNIHGAYGRITSLLSATEAVVTFPHEEQQGLVPYREGDLLWVSNGDTLRETGSVRIKGVDVFEGRRELRLTFDEDISEKLHVGDLLENPDRMPEILIRGNVIEGCPHMRLSSSKKTVVADNILDLSIADVLVSDLLEFWYESGAVTHMEITGNVFRNRESRGGNIRISSTRREYPKLHGRIVIRNNVFPRAVQDAVRADYVRELILEGNRTEEGLPEHPTQDSESS